MASCAGVRFEPVQPVCYGLSSTQLDRVVRAFGIRSTPVATRCHSSLPCQPFSRLYPPLDLLLILTFLCFCSLGAASSTVCCVGFLVLHLSIDLRSYAIPLAHTSGLPLALASVYYPGHVFPSSSPQTHFTPITTSPLVSPISTQSVTKRYNRCYALRSVYDPNGVIQTSSHDFPYLCPPITVLRELCGSSPSLYLSLSATSLSTLLNPHSNVAFLFFFSRLFLSPHRPHLPGSASSRSSFFFLSNFSTST